ncbi:MAG TPA: hypothetical protein VFW86_02665, partial [Candidatus Limnocylindrales bacterium]|nr:hypothetical protein [Candidatus Limnocylindrales bacterium]
ACCRPTSGSTLDGVSRGPAARGEAMYEITSSDSDRAIRDGQIAVVVCATCGCRLEAAGTGADIGWFHFGRAAGRDARGCRAACVDARHDAEGRAALAA